MLWELVCTTKKPFKFCEMQHFSDLRDYGTILQAFSDTLRNCNSSLYFG